MTGQQLKNSILQMAIQGKLVPQDPHDEPASVLLERIREEKRRLVKEKILKKSYLHSNIYRDDDCSYFEKANKKVICIDEEIPFELPNNWRWERWGSPRTLWRSWVDSWGCGRLCAPELLQESQERQNRTLVTQVSL